MKKRILAILLTLIMVFSMLPEPTHVHAATQTGCPSCGGLSFNVSSKTLGAAESTCKTCSTKHKHNETTYTPGKWEIVKFTNLTNGWAQL